MNSILKRMNKVGLSLAFVVSTGAAMVFTAGIVWADSPHFTKVTATLQNDGDVDVKFKEVGLGNSLNIDYLATADTEVTCTCVTRSGKCPSAANKTTFEAQASASGTFPSGKNGSVSATLTIPAPECPASQPPTCGGGQELRLSAISYKNIKIKDTTNFVEATATPSSFSTTFFTCP